MAFKTLTKTFSGRLALNLSRCERGAVWQLIGATEAEPTAYRYCLTDVVNELYEPFDTVLASLETNTPQVEENHAKWLFWTPHEDADDNTINILYDGEIHVYSQDETYVRSITIQADIGEEVDLDQVITNGVSSHFGITPRTKKINTEADYGEVSIMVIEPHKHDTPTATTVNIVPLG